MAILTTLYIYLSAFAIQIGLYLLVFSKLTFYRKKENKYETPEPVSVIICGRNEEKNLEKNLPIILNQNYKTFEVIVVNDASEDNTMLVLDELMKKYSNLKVITISKEEKKTEGKKQALDLAIRSSNYEWLLFTDADCAPVSRNWVRLMAGNFINNKSVVLGYSPYKKNNSFVNWFIRYDTFYTALQYFSFTLNKMPYMGVGRNMAYRKSLYMNFQGFKNHLQFICGDDDLFVNQAADQNNTAIEISKESFMVSDPKKTFLEFFIQKKRHFGAGKYYKNKHKIALGLVILSNFIFYYGFCVLLIIGIVNLKWIFMIFFVRYMVQLIILSRISKLLDESKLFLFFLPLLEFLYLGFEILVYFSNLFIPKHKWQ